MSYSDMQVALAKGSPAGLAMAVERGFILTDHLELIDRELIEAIARAESGRANQAQILLVTVPPRHGKSTLISVYTPAWYLGLFPERRVILTSYEGDFAASWGMRVRDLLAEHGGGLYGVEISRSSRAARRWDLSSGGGMITAGVGGAITGRGANLLIIDDPLKSAEAAMSAVIREKQWDWWLATVRTRLEPGSVVVVLMTRWHQADLGGRLLAEGKAEGDEVREIRLPAIAEAGDLLAREVGEALWPGRFPRSWLEQTRKTMGPYWFSAMYQGRPTPDEGGIFSRGDFRYFEVKDDLVVLVEPDGTHREFGVKYCNKATYVDLAVSERESADFTALVEAWVTPQGDLLIAEVHRDRIPAPEQVDYIAERYVGTIKLEVIGYQTALLQELVRQGYPVEPVRPDKDKVTRASAAGALYKQGKVFHRKGARWLGEFESELLVFPVGEHDDQVDALAYAARDLPAMVRPATRRQRHRGTTISGGLLDEAL